MKKTLKIWLLIIALLVTVLGIYVFFLYLNNANTKKVTVGTPFRLFSGQTVQIVGTDEKIKFDGMTGGCAPRTECLVGPLPKLRYYIKGKEIDYLDSDEKTNVPYLFESKYDKYGDNGVEYMDGFLVSQGL